MKGELRVFRKIVTGSFYNNSSCKKRKYPPGIIKHLEISVFNRKDREWYIPHQRSGEALGSQRNH